MVMARARHVESETEEAATAVLMLFSPHAATHG